MGKKNLTKSQLQKQSLQNFYQRKSDAWTRPEIIEFSNKIKLTRQQVYKWLWDRRNLSKQKDVDKNVKEEDLLMGKQKWKKVAYKKFTLKVPKSKQNVTCFVVNYKVSAWVANVLKFEGWQLIRQKPQFIANESSESHSVGQSESNQSLSPYLVKQEEQYNNYEVNSQQIKHASNKIDANFPIQPIGRYSLRKRPARQCSLYQMSLGLDENENDIYESDA